jgi:L-seryl-tRNA(Ser) seleniumtransferase
VVNNNAAAVFLTLNTFGSGKEAIISRGQLIEIGGSFRIPDVMQQSGSAMVEIGTTNKTHLRDYRKAISEKTGLICVVHPSNYRVKGFTADPELSAVVELAHEHGVPVLQDLGGGVLFDLQQFGLPYEPVVSESVAAGVDIVTFSGDKVLGGPQCGIIVGKAEHIDKIKTNPLMRTLRCDKLIFAVLESTLKTFLRQDDVLRENQVMRLLLLSDTELAERAHRLYERLSTAVKEKCDVSVATTAVQIGSGALPLEEIKSRAISLQPYAGGIAAFAKKLRAYDPPIIGYIREDRLFLDLRTIFEAEEPLVLQAIETITGSM